MLVSLVSSVVCVLIYILVAKLTGVSVTREGLEKEIMEIFLTVEKVFATKIKATGEEKLDLAVELVEAKLGTKLPFFIRGEINTQKIQNLVQEIYSKYKVKNS